MKKLIIGGGCAVKASPVFRRDIKALESRYSDTKQRFDSGLIAGCVRCRWGRVKVLVCRPFSVKGRPFPTTFWLVCPHLVRRAGTIESQGGVGELEEFLSSRNMLHEWREYNYLHQVIRLRLMDRESCRYMRKYHARVFRSVMRSGIGGMKYGENINVKCLHLQAASLIALGHHPGSEWLKSKSLCEECAEGLCK